MRKNFLLIFLFIFAALPALSDGAGAQSGRRGMTPLPQPTPEQLSEPPIVVSNEREPVAPAALKVLPDKILKRKLQALEAGSFSLADFGGKVIVINIWASWCGPCRREVPEYEKVRQAFAGREVEFIGLTTEDPRTASERVRKFVRDFHFGFRQGWADRETASTLMNGRDGVPQTLVIAADGGVISHWVGYSPRRGGDYLRDLLEHTVGAGGGSRQSAVSSKQSVISGQGRVADRSSVSDW